MVEAVLVCFISSNYIMILKRENLQACMYCYGGYTLSKLVEFLSENYYYDNYDNDNYNNDNYDNDNYHNDNYHNDNYHDDYYHSDNYHNDNYL